MFYNVDDNILAKQFEQILVRVKNKDRNSLKAMFSKEALEELKSIDEDIDCLFTFFQDDVVFCEKNSFSIFRNRIYGEKVI